LVGPYPPPYGGIATHIVGLAPFLAEHGYKVTVLTLTYDKTETFSPAVGVDVVRVNVRRWAWRLANLRQVVRLGHKLRAADFEWIAREIIGTSIVAHVAREREAALISSHMITSSMFVPHLKRRLGERLKFVTTIFGELAERRSVIERNRGFYRRVLV